ncbi:MAG: 50S ribosomal protein L18 [candidate division Zixibacteria bacterium]|nr:50S ribosomal protein L18 [candidate division Zixibacteria bacterium]MDH3937956.1 50S ribosomal protein L18 [candidate division Zixibacteria bacterium]
MADKNVIKDRKAARRRRRVRGKVHGSAERPRFSVAKSLNRVFAQLIDDENHVTLLGVDSTSSVLKAELDDTKSKIEKARKVGEVVARLAKEKGIEQVVFDRNQNRFHGRIKAVAEGAREGGLKF